MIFLSSTISGLQAQAAALQVTSWNYESLKQQLNYTTELTLETNKRYQTAFSNRTEARSHAPNMSNIPSAYNYEHLAIFCKLEVQVEKATKIPIKFRLGEVNQIERLEGKPYTPFLIGN